MARSMAEPLISIEQAENDEIISLDFADIAIQDGVTFDTRRQIVTTSTAVRYNLSYASFCLTLSSLSVLLLILGGCIIAPIVLNIDMPYEQSANSTVSNDTLSSTNGDAGDATVTSPSSTAVHGPLATSTAVHGPLATSTAVHGPLATKPPSRSSLLLQTTTQPKTTTVIDTINFVKSSSMSTLTEQSRTIPTTPFLLPGSQTQTIAPLERTIPSTATTATDMKSTAEELPPGESSNIATTTTNLEASDQTSTLLSTIFDTEESIKKEMSSEMP